MWPHQIDKLPRLDTDLLSFLHRLNLSHLTKILQKEEVVSMEALLSLEREDLKDIGIKINDRKIIVKETSKLNNNINSKLFNALQRAAENGHTPVVT